jgi:hypothetical protein
MNWKVFEGVATGTSHLERMTACQDACRTWTGGDGFLVAVVCDGAGSASLSEIGSRICSDAVVERIASCLNEQLEEGGDALQLVKNQLEASIQHARERIEEAASEKGVTPRDLACTLVGAVAKATGGGFFFHVGDGAAIVHMADASIAPVVSRPENGEYSNETWFVTQSSWRDHLRVTDFAGDIRCIAVMSDGPMPFALTKDQSSLFPGFIDPIEDYLRKNSVEDGNRGLLSILTSERTNSITNDDKTLVLAFLES